MNVENKEIYQLLTQSFTNNCKNIGLDMPLILYNNSNEPQIQELYDECRQNFNRRFDYFPKFIILCQGQMQPWYSDEPDSIQQQVSSVVNLINDYNEHLLNRRSPARVPLSLAVCSGGHDHEGESSGNNVIQINFSHTQEIKHYEEGGDHYVELQPGVGFERLLTDLDNKEVRLGIPHGTCATVHVPGYIMGGGWGPWTRKFGMSCEYLMEVDLVLGDGSLITAKASGSDAEQSLLWALRGGGGLSYGIATRFKIKAFRLPEQEGKFTLNWNYEEFTPDKKRTKTLDILNAWEAAITGNANPRLIGTNLQIIAKPGEPDYCIDEAVHQCSMYGYFEGSRDQALVEINNIFGDLGWEGADQDCIHWQDRLDADGNSTPISFSDWDRTSTAVMTKKQTPEQEMLPGDIPPEHDEPSPHKISSRLTGNNWGEEGRKNLIRSLCSPLLHEKGITAGVKSYVTLGAISGPYYSQDDLGEDTLGVSFPYRDRLYTIQYQVWWNQDAIDLDAQNYANRAMDWIEEARRREFPQTNGSFISFKDAAIPTEQYFQQNYEELKRVKDTYSQDPNNILRSRKTII